MFQPLELPFDVPLPVLVAVPAVVPCWLDVLPKSWLNRFAPS